MLESEDGAVNYLDHSGAKPQTQIALILRDLVLRMYWDDEEEPSVESPLGDFFCCGFGRECNVNSMPIAVVPSRGLNCYFQMPFRKKARITLENQHVNPIPAFFLPGGLIACMMRDCRRYRISLPRTVEKRKDHSAAERLCNP